jgi:drug/metabolite transporter (DMT)-like permease
MNNWLFFALLAPFLWGMANVIDGALRRHFVRSDMALTWMMAFLRLPFVIAFFLAFGIEIPSISVILFMFLAGILWTFPFIFYYKAIEAEDPSRIALLLQLTPLFTLLIAFFAIQETLTANQGIAFILLVIGGAVAATKRLKGAWRLSKAFFLMVLATFLWASSDVLFKKFELSFSSFLTAFAIYFFGSFLVSAILMSYPHGRQKILKHFTKLPVRAWLMIVSTAVVGVGGSMTFAYALTLGKASLTSVIIGIQPLFVLGLGLLLAPFIREIRKEDLSKRALLLKGISFILILIGLVFLEF